MMRGLRIVLHGQSFHTIHHTVKLFGARGSKTGTTEQGAALPSLKDKIRHVIDR